MILTQNMKERLLDMSYWDNSQLIYDDNMKTIEIFLTSSEELTDDCYAFGNLVRRLD